MKLKLSGILENSLVNGEGMRYVIFVSGCKHHCDGCQNKHTWDINSGMDMDIDEIFEDIKNNLPLIDGITYSGGDPMEQTEALIVLSDKLKKEFNINIWCYTGYTLEEILESSDNNKKLLLKYINTLVDGEFEKDNTKGALKYTGSTNQKIIYLENGKPDKARSVEGYINYI